MYCQYFIPASITMKSTVASSEVEEAISLAVRDIILRNYVRISDGELSTSETSIVPIPSDIIIEGSKSKVEGANSNAKGEFVVSPKIMQLVCFIL